MKNDAKAVIHMTCVLGLLCILGFWISIGVWPFGGEGPITTLLKTTLGNDFDVICLGEGLTRGAICAGFVPVAFLAWTLKKALEEDDENETTSTEEDAGNSEELVIEE